MESDTNASTAIPIHAQAQTVNAAAVPMPFSMDSTGGSTHQFLGLRAKLSRALATPTNVFVLYSAYQLYRNRDSITSFTSRAKEAVASDCYALEQSTNSMAALPRFAAEGVVHGLVTALQTTISQIGYGLDVVLNGFLAALEVMVTLLTSIWRCFLENLSNSGIPLLSEIGNGGVQAIDQINQAMLSILEKPFSELSGVIRQHMADPRIELSVHIEDITTPHIAFCAEKLDFAAVDKLGVEMRCWILYAAVALLVAAVGMTACNAVMISYEHTRWSAQLARIRQKLEDFHFAEESRLSQEVVGERKFLMAEQDALRMVNTARHPLLSDFLDWFSRRLLRMKEHSAQRFIWFGYYIAHPPAVACLLIGLFGLIFTYSQLVMIDYSRSHARPILATALDDLSDVIQSLVTREIQNASKAFALSTNVALSQLESGLNDNVFGSIVKSAGELGAGLKAVQETMIQGIQAVFGEGAFSLLVLSVLQCLFFKKLAVIESGLVWLQENANIRLPRLSEHVLVPEPTELYNLITNIMADRMPGPSSSPSLPSDRLSEGAGGYLQRGIRIAEDSVSEVLDLYESEVSKDLPIYYSLVGIWYLLLAMGLVGTRGLKTNI
ncbi:plasma membrane fusion protein prm1 [Mortierella alpina]|uniref:Plasma membrane fusion protein PRM1 n=1 Tax=Mortierella alpina TaxID=64518 RepID=A0A9P6JE61_MORAP|nr:plasma membrane fusion protein prm1 [Mortierella alpina]